MKVHDIVYVCVCAGVSIIHASCQPVSVKLCVCASVHIYVGKMSLILLTDANCTTSVIPLIHGWTNAGIPESWII